jgi:hypothetical protein
MGTLRISFADTEREVRESPTIIVERNNRLLLKVFYVLIDGCVG